MIPLNTISCGRAEDLIPQLEDNSIPLVIFSPPYAEQRKKHYSGVPEKEYPAWMAGIMKALMPKVTADGSVFLNIRPHIYKGELSDYVLRMRLAIRELGWKECEELIWYKFNAPPLGRVDRPRRAWESVFWYSKNAYPYSDLKACGEESEHLGFRGSYKYDDEGGSYLHAQQNVKPYKGKARITDVLEVNIEITKGVNHSAVFPRRLPSILIQSFSKPGDTVLDPFMGSGTTGLAARDHGRNFIGIELDPAAVELANSRLAKESVKQRVKSPPKTPPAEPRIVQHDCF